MPRLYIIAGCNGSGKTTASYTVLPELLECSEWVNSDEFAKSLSPFKPESAAIMASRYMLLKTRMLFRDRKDFAIETTLATRSLLKMVMAAQRQGYFVELLYLWLPTPEMAVERIRARVAAGGHNIDEETVRRRYYTGLSYLFNDYMNTCDKWTMADNSTPPFKLIAEGSATMATIHDWAAFRELRKLVPKGQYDTIRRRSPSEFVPREVLEETPDAHDGVPAPQTNGNWK